LRVRLIGFSVLAKASQSLLHERFWRIIKSVKSSFQLLVREHQSSDGTAQITTTAGDYFINRRFVFVEKSTGVCV
jgi:hypothetical protein